MGRGRFHETLIPNSPRKPIRIWMEVGDRDLLNPNTMRDDMHDWVLANERMAQVLAAKHYPYQFVFAKNAVHVDRATRSADVAGGAGVGVAGVQGEVATLGLVGAGRATPLRGATFLHPTTAIIYA